MIKEMENYKIDILGVSEMRWTGQGRMDSRGKTVLYSGKEQHHTHGVGIFLSKTAAQTLVSWKPINERIIMARFHTRYAQPILETVNSRLEAFIHELSIVCPSFIPALPGLQGCVEGL